MIIKILLTIICTVISAWLYHKGGNGPKAVRRFGCPAVTVALMIIWGYHTWWVLLGSYVLNYATLTTYWKGSAEDVKWYHWILTGIGYSISLILAPLATGNWLGFVMRTVICTLGVSLISVLSGKAWKEEYGRGAFNTGTVPLLTFYWG